MMRDKPGVVQVLVVTVWLLAAPASAHFVPDKDGNFPIAYPNALPRTLCYRLVGKLAESPSWKRWAKAAAEGWNNAKTGWRFEPCPPEQKVPDIVISFSDAYGTPPPGGAVGHSAGGSADEGFWHIYIVEDVRGASINRRKVNGGKTGWAEANGEGETTLDPILVLEHEMGHALGLDHDDNAKCDTGNLEEPICPDNHDNPSGRAPSASDVAEVKKGIKTYEDAVKRYKEAHSGGAATGSTGGSDVKSHGHTRRVKQRSEDDPLYMEDYQPPQHSTTAPVHAPSYPVDRPHDDDGNETPDNPSHGMPDIPIPRDYPGGGQGGY